MRIVWGSSGSIIRLTCRPATRGPYPDNLSDEVGQLLECFCQKAERSGLKPFVKTIRARRAGILAALRLEVDHARHAALNRRVPTIVTRAFGFHSARTAIAVTVQVSADPIRSRIPGGQSMWPLLNRPTGVSRQTTTWSASIMCTSPVAPAR